MHFNKPFVYAKGLFLLYISQVSTIRRETNDKIKC